MGYRHFSLQIIIRIILIAISCWLFIWSFFQDYLIMAKFTLGLIFLIQVLLLIQYIRKTNKKLIKFLELIKNEGLMERFSDEENEITQKNINEHFNRIIQILADSKIDKESEHFYFQQTLEVIGTSIISIREDDSIEIFNKAARELLQIDAIKNLSELEDAFPAFTNLIRKIGVDEQILFKLQVNSETKMLSVRCSKFKILDRKLKLISFQNISSELANEELDAWQKLIQVLRHEIMNSVTPIKSLTNTLVKLISSRGSPKKVADISDNTIEQAFEGLQAIQKRNTGMLKFVESYRNLTKIPPPVIITFKISELFSSIKILMQEELNKNRIQVDINIEPANLTLNADEKQISQVLINLIRNSIEATANITDRKIYFEALRTKQKSTVLKVKDNGCGIPEEVRENIFIPFFTTRKGGSGIGLSLSRQIMRLHKGSINVSSELDVETEFWLEFPIAKDS